VRFSSGSFTIRAAMKPAGLHVVHHHEDAPGPRVVLVHGAPERSSSFNRVVQLLGDLPVTVYDRRGYGKSLGAGAEGAGFDAHADDLIAILDATPSVVVGQSAGGAIAMLAATRAPQLFLALGVWEPPMTAWDCWPPDVRESTLALGRVADPAAAAESFSRLALGDERWEQLPERTRDLVRAEGAAFCADMASQDSRFFEVERLRVPRLLGCGTVLTALMNPSHEGVFARSAAETGCELLVFEGADHRAAVTRPDVWAQFVRATVELATRTDRAEH
jgi:pimeloyl-ACP methyl ester carboxylesterase